MKKINLKKEHIKKIKKLYLKEKLSLRNIAKKLDCSTTLIARVLKEEGYE